VGIEQSAKSPETQRVSQQRGAESGAPGAPDELAEVVAAWPNLSPAARRVILSIARGQPRQSK
jgi:hypothetical protein